MDNKGQISAEMILLVGAMLVVVIVAGGYIYGLNKNIAGNITDVTNVARDNTLGRL